MKFDTGIVVIGVAIILFYLRLAMLRGKKRRERRAEQLAVMKAGKKVKFQEQDPNRPYYQVTSWWIVGVSMLLILAGMISKTTTSLPQLLQQYWWVTTSIGILLFAFSFK
jgi:multisubunit Na+/H+ antiporter MnhB subunit